MSRATVNRAPSMTSIGDSQDGRMAKAAAQSSKTEGMECESGRRSAVAGTVRVSQYPEWYVRRDVGREAQHQQCRSLCLFHIVHAIPAFHRSRNSQTQDRSNSAGFCGLSTPKSDSCSTAVSTSYPGEQFRQPDALMSRYRAPQALDGDCGASKTMMEMR